MMQQRLLIAARRTLAVLFLTGSLFVSAASFAQSLPTIRTTFGARNVLEPSPCFEFACFNRASYDGNTLAAIGATYPAVYVFLRLSSGPWYQQRVLQNRTALAPGYDTAGYRYPIAVVGDDILVTAFQSGPDVPATCATHVFGRTGTSWQVKQVIDTCAGQFAKDGHRILFGTAGQMPIYGRGANGLFSEESRVFPPSAGIFNAQKSIALHGWTVVIGTPLANSETGAAYIFQRRSGQWLLLETLVPDGGGGTRFGASVAAYEYNVAVGAPGAVNPSGVGRGLIYMYTGVGDNWAISQEITEPPGTDNTFGTALAMRGRRLVVSADNFYPYATGPFVYLYERGVRQSDWTPRGQFATGNGLSIELSGSTALVDVEGLRFGTFPAIVNLPALREPDVAP